MKPCRIIAAIAALMLLAACSQAPSDVAQSSTATFESNPSEVVSSIVPSSNTSVGTAQSELASNAESSDAASNATESGTVISSAVISAASGTANSPSSVSSSSSAASSSAATSSNAASSTAPKYPVYSGTRDPWLWPFSRESIWNMPIGSNAVYAQTNFVESTNVSFDPEHFAIAKASDPQLEIYRYTSFKNRWPGSDKLEGKIYCPDSFIVPEKYRDGNLKNSCSAILQPNGTVAHIAPACRPEGSTYMTGYLYKRNTYTLYSDGIGGSHGGSGLSVLGGSIRKGELTGEDPIRHAIKINIYAHNYCYYGSDRKGFVWPADRADGYANNKNDNRYYNGSDRNVVMGSLLALPPDVTVESLGLKTEVAKRLFYALQNYGAYVSDDSAWNSYCFCVEDGVSEEVEAKYGYDLKDNNGDYYKDCMKIFKALCVITNNSPTSIGGGGTPRQPLAPDFE